MRLERFQVKNYRSIKSTRWISLRNSLTVIGPNNEGKSNLVRALVTSLKLLEELASPRVMLSSQGITRYRRVGRSYEWEKDCPLDLQIGLNTTTEFKLEFSLNDNDIDEFSAEIGSSINQKLPITITIGRDHVPNFEVNKPGKGYAVLSGKDIAEIRDALGVRISDNLQNSRLVIICEGSADDKALGKLLGELDPRIATSLQTAEVALSPLKGSGNLSYMATTLQNSICEPICFLDDDLARRTAMDRAVVDQVLSATDFVLTSRLGKKESEFEDLIQDSILEDIVSTKYKADLKKIPAGMRSRKFTDRAKASLEVAGRPWNEATKLALKKAVAERCLQLGLKAIAPEKRGPLESLASLVVERLGLE